MSEKDDVIDVEASEKDAGEKGNKKAAGKKASGGFASFFNKAKASINEGLLEERLRTAYRQGHTEFDYYAYGDNSFFNSSSVYGELSDNTLTYFGTTTLPKYAIVVDTETDKAYAVMNDPEKVEVTCELDGKEYKRPGMKIVLDPEVTEVKVIKADNRYFLYKGE